MTNNSEVSIFIFKGYTWSQQTGKAEFSYQVNHNGEEFTFIEKVQFPVPLDSSSIPQKLQKTILDNLLLVLGVSYYKLFCPKNIVLETVLLTKEQAAFWNTLYTKGLGEFFYRNKIDFRGLVQFPYSTILQKSVAFSRQNRALVGIGGGKDSIVTAELLKKEGKPFACFVVNQHPIRDKIIGIIGKEQVVVSRKIDSQLFILNKRPDAYNGHIPVSAQYAFLGLFTALLCDYRYVIVSNEESSNYGNVMYHGMEVNHQWSKSFAFEKLFQEYVKRFIITDVFYFSLLRRQTEIAITKQFVQYPRYFKHFSSCNRNFRIIGEGSDRLWCGECAKCAFSFVMLAAFLSKKEVLTIFGKNLFIQKSLLQTYKELLGVSKIKPFDCVGMPEEVIVSFFLAMKRGEYSEDMIMQFFQKDVLPEIKNIDKLEKQVFAKKGKGTIPSEFFYSL
jgi:UDP-N-acetyl-alpha-D-muramoyl-L-alanyl-L-glutamate epimerase